MNEQQKPVGEEQLAALLRLAGPRERVPDVVRQRVHAAVREEWQRSVGRSRFRRWSWALAAAAALFFAVFIVRREPQPSISAPVPQIAAVARVVKGDATAGRAPESRALAETMALEEGTVVETSPGAVASFDWSGGSLRLAGGSALRIDSTSALTLVSGTMYFASGPASPRVTVHTPAGIVRDIGTQFELRAADSVLRVRVREGQVDLERSQVRYLVQAGTELQAAASGAITRVPIPTSGSEWDWVTAAAPPMTLEGTMGDVLAKIAREKGLELKLRDTSLSSVPVHSTIPMDTDEALEAAAAAAGVRYRIVGGTLIVERERDARR